MSLLKDIEAERSEITSQTRLLTQLVMTEACDTVSESRDFVPVVAALVDGQTELRFPTWHSPQDKERKFASISKALQDKNATAAVVALPGSWSSKKKKTQRAVIILVHTLNWRRMMVLPFHLSDEDVVIWDEPHTTDDFKSPLIQLSCAN